jgi:hypothetical protein
VSVLSTRFAEGDADNLRSAPVSHDTGYARRWHPTIAQELGHNSAAVSVRGSEATS